MSLVCLSIECKWLHLRVLPRTASFVAHSSCFLIHLTESRAYTKIITRKKRWIIFSFEMDVRRHFVPTTNCPTGIFWATNCPRWQNVPLSPHATNCPSDKMSHFLPGDKMSHWWSYWKTIVSLAFFRRQIVPRWQNVPLSPRRQNVPTYALMHMKVMESCWDILSPVKKAIGTICRKWKRPVLGIFRGIFFCQETLQH